MGQRNRAVYNTIDGVKHKLCTGFSHPEGVFLPLSQFSQRDGRPVHSECRTCETYRRGAEPTVPVGNYLKFLEAIVKRIGVQETARRLGRTQSWIYQVTHGKTRKMQRRSARVIVSLYAELIRTGEVRHKDSIRHGSLVRGHKEKQAKNHRDFYKSHGDEETERRRRHREQEEDDLIAS